MSLPIWNLVNGSGDTLPFHSADVAAGAQAIWCAILFMQLVCNWTYTYGGLGL